MSTTPLTKSTYTQLPNISPEAEETRPKYEPYSTQYGSDILPSPAKKRSLSTFKKSLLFLAAMLLLFLIYGAGLLTMFFLKKSTVQSVSNVNPQHVDLDDNKLHSVKDNKNTKYTKTYNYTTTYNSSQTTLPDMILPANRGTNENNKFIGGGPTGANLLGDDYEKIAVNPDRNPLLPLRMDSCIFTHEHQLGFDGTASKGIWRRTVERPIERGDVVQGNIGDCGFGASLLALIANDQYAEIRRSLILFEEQKKFLAVFRVPQSLKIVNGKIQASSYRSKAIYIDDKLGEGRVPAGFPQPKEWCPSYIGFFPSFTPSRNLFVPLLEKAWAKYVDANPSNRIHFQDDRGYRGLTATPSHKVLQAMTGKQGRFVYRSKKGLDAPIAVQILRCITNHLACVVGTGAANMSDIGDVDKAGLLSNDAGDMGAGVEGKTYTIIERQVPRRVVTLLKTHAYAIDNEATGEVDVTSSETVFNHVVVLRNPWNCNPIVSSKGECNDGKDGALQIRLGTLWYVMVSVEWAENP